MSDVEALNLQELVGQPVDEARAIVVAAGGTVRLVEPGGAVTLDYRPDRVTLIADAGLVVRVHGRG